MINSITDEFGRTFKTLRVSLTNTCNLACSYCVDISETKKSKNSEQKVLTTEQYIQLIQILHNILSLETVRLTGGEPTLYKELIPLINGIKNTGINQIKMTSNATQLDAINLKNAGLSSVNISLDAIDDNISFNISKRRKLQQTLTNIEKAIGTGLQVKINCVVMKGVNDNQLLKIFEYGKKRNISVRFLELMQMGHLHHNYKEYFISEKEIIKTINAHYDITPLNRDINATAKYWITNDGYKFGIIANESDPFCNDCNRLRLDSYGNIYGCLSNNHPINILGCLDNEEELKIRLVNALSQKKTKFSGSALSMLHIGG
ncbi:MAG: GTP 3',8-cyclase MoaA [Chitinophagales bacterium]